MMLFVGEFTDEQLKAEGLADLILNFQDAPNKDFLRVLVKLLSDYASEANPPAHLLDIVRRSATAPLADQEVFIARLVKLGKFKKIRTKETLTDPDADIKFVNVCMAYTPTSKGPKGKPTAISYAAMLADSRWAAMVAAVQARNPDISDLMKDAAMSLLGHKSIAKKPVTMIIEFQMYVAEFLGTKKALHAIYKFDRPANLVDLTKDLAKFATNRDMAYKAEGGAYNEGYRLRLKRDYLRLGLPQEQAGKLDLERSPKLQAATDKRGAAEVFKLIMRYCGAFEIKVLK